MVVSSPGRLHIACSTNARFAPDCAVMLASLMATNPSESIHVHLLHDGSLPGPAVDALRELVVSAGGRCDPVEVPRDQTGTWPDSVRFPANAWYRIRLAELLADLPRVLYVDVDTLFMAPVAALWDTDLGGCPIGAVTSPLYPSMIPRIEAGLGLSSATYFNSGVLLLDLGVWRAERTKDTIASYVGSHLHQLVWPDQDALNGALAGRQLALHPRWNAMPELWELGLGRLPYTRAELRDATSDPAIVHFAGPHKPWHVGSRSPYRSEWLDYLERTPWRGRPIEGRRLPHAVLKRLPLLWSYQAQVKLHEWRNAIGS